MGEDTTRADAARGIERRSFLRLGGVLGLGLASCAVPATLTRQRVRLGGAHRVARTEIAMGTFVSMTLVHDSPDQAEEAMDLAFEEIDRLTRILGRYDPDTPLSRLNRRGVIEQPPAELAEVIRSGLRFSRLSGGAFDVTIAPVLELLRRRAPAGELERARALVGFEGVTVEGDAVRLRRPGMRITLDGIAKGYIVDRAAELIRRRGVESFLINGGGDIRARGRDRPWTVGIRDPAAPGRVLEVIRLRDGAIATSGGYELYFDRDKTSHHLVDPRTGHSPRATASVSATAPTAMAADALSTALFVIGPTRGPRLARALPGCECLVICGGDRVESPGWAALRAPGARS